MHDHTSSRAPLPLSLTQPAPPGWQNDRPAFPDDPFMDWESETERPPKGPFEAANQSAPR
ncbi:MAG TPA: hypothetical protein VK191_03800 [Symbiobacteriaceae bacterium]|nr:hypothetical protein [Symbiobacteriaceae bacterium]